MTTYRDAGVDLEAYASALAQMREAVRSTFTEGVLTDLGSFGGMFALPRGTYREPVLVATMDGVGTKLKVAFLMNRHDTVGQDLVFHCVNDLLVQGARPLFFLDYLATGRLRPEVVAEIVGGIAAACREVGCALLGGETAEMPGFYAEGEYDLAGCMVGIVERSEILEGSRSIEVGDVLLGLPSSGLHTNGYSLARKVLFEQAGYRVEDWVPELGCTLGEELLRVHRCYLRAVEALRSQVRLKALAHITGGGFYENIPRVLPPGTMAVVESHRWTPPPIFRLIAERGKVPKEEMYRTFNMGIGMVAFLPPEDVAKAQEALRPLGWRASVIGEVRPGEGGCQVL